MSWLAIAVTDGKGLVAELVDGELVIVDGHDVAAVAEQVRFGPRRFLNLRELWGGTSYGLAGGGIRRIRLSVRECMQRRKLGRRGHGGERVIYVLTPCFVGTQEAERRWVTHGDEGAKGGAHPQGR
eukprot:6213659-Pleurochrysis_carterae.AAC.1